MNLIKQLIEIILKKFYPIYYARKKGVIIGDNCRINHTTYWGTEPWLIFIGNHVEISFEVAFITHDGATWVFREKERYQDVIKFGKIIVGDNCFIGARSTILPGVTIGKNSIIAAGAVLTQSVPEGQLWGGVPANYICDVHEYAEKCLKGNPQYDKSNYMKNKKEELLRILDDGGIE